MLLSRDQDGGELVVKETYASPSLNAPDHLFALHRDYTSSYQRGTVVVSGDGTPIGLASHAGRFYGQSIVLGGLSLRYLPAVLLDSAIHLLERPPSDLDITGPIYPRCGRLLQAGRNQGRGRAGDPRAVDRARAGGA